MLAGVSLAATMPSASFGVRPPTVSQTAARPGNGSSGNAAISADGRFVAIASEASDLVKGDTNGVFDVFVRDLARKTTERVSISTADEQANADTGLDAISSDGRFVVMWSTASNLVPGDTNSVEDIFVRDRVGGSTELVSVSTAGTPGDAPSVHAAISADGRFVAFSSRASNLGGGEADVSDVFVRDRVAGRTEHVGAGSWPSISADGRYVAFAARVAEVASDVIVVVDRTTGAKDVVSVGMGGAPPNHLSHTASLSADGRFVAFVSWATNLVPDDTNAPGPGRTSADVFVRDRLETRTTRVSIASDGAQLTGGQLQPDDLG